MEYAMELEKANATIAQQAAMIEHLRGGLGNEPQLTSCAEDMSTCTLTNGDGIGYCYNLVDPDLPTPLYTAVDMANAARDGFRDGAASVVVTLSKGDSLARRMSGPQEDGSSPLISRADAVAAIEAAGGTVQGGTKCKDYGHGGFSCGADDCWLRSEPRP
jgi:hypothetical protein